MTGLKVMPSTHVSLDGSVSHDRGGRCERSLGRIRTRGVFFGGLDAGDKSTARYFDSADVCDSSQYD